MVAGGAEAGTRQVAAERVGLCAIAMLLAHRAKLKEIAASLDRAQVLLALWLEVVCATTGVAAVACVDSSEVELIGIHRAVVR